jgi:hypothetical protein
VTPENNPPDAPRKRRVHPNSLKNLKPDPARGNAGGARERGGRPKGALGRLTKENLAKAKAGGILPLDYMLKVMRNSKARADRRDWAAKEAAPYLHPKIASIEHSGNVQLTHEQALQQLAEEDGDEV